VFQPTAPLSYEFVQNFIRSTQAFVFPSYFRLRIKATGGYVQDLMTLTRQLKLLVGARFDRYQQRYLDEPTNALQNTTDKRVSPRVGLVYQPVEMISLYAAYGSSFSPQFPGQLTVDNRALKPSVGEQYEAGVRLNAWQG
jgi:outer membrane receptor protein involved in Fe transport